MKTNMNNQIKVILDANGVDSSKYFSIDLPDNVQEIRINSSAPVNYRPDCSLPPTSSTGRAYAEKSALHNKIMDDGAVFNPYIHRRFLPAQYLNMVPVMSDGKRRSYEESMKYRYSYTYTIQHTISEVNKLAMLQKHDPGAFAERSCFMSPIQAMMIFEDYVRDMKQYLANMEKEYYAIPKRKKVTSRQRQMLGAMASWEERIEAWETAIDKFRRQMSYNDISKIVGSVKIYDLPHETKKSRTFVECFKANGAYYTMKHLIMFKGFRLKQTATTFGSLAELKEMRNLEGYKLHAILLEMLNQNPSIKL